MSHQPESAEEDQPRTMLSRRGFLFLGGTGLAIVGSVLATKGWRDSRHVAPTLSDEIIPEATPEENAKSIADALNTMSTAYGVKVAIDYRLNFSDKNSVDSYETDKVLGVDNPLILDDGVYGYTRYNYDTGEIHVSVAPPGTLVELPDGESLGHLDSNPRIETVDISHVYYQSPSGQEQYNPTTIIGTYSGPIPEGAYIEHAGELVFSMR